MPFDLQIDEAGIPITNNAAYALGQVTDAVLDGWHIGGIVHQPGLRVVVPDAGIQYRQQLLGFDETACKLAGLQNRQCLFGTIGIGRSNARQCRQAAELIGEAAARRVLFEAYR